LNLFNSIGLEGGGNRTSRKGREKGWGGKGERVGRPHPYVTTNLYTNVNMMRNLNLGAKIGTSFGVGLAIITALGIISYRTTTNLIDNSQWQTHTYRVLGELEDLVSQLQDAEIGQRGYIVTGDKSSLEPYSNAIPSIKKSLKSLREITKDSLQQQVRIDKLEPLIYQRLAIIEKRIELRQNEGFEAARQLILTDSGRSLTNDIRRITSEMESDEQNLLNKRNQKTKIATQEAIQTIGIGIPSTFFLLTLIGIYLNRSISNPLQDISKKTSKLADGDLSVSVPESSRRDEVGVLVQSFNRMVVNLRETTTRNEEQNWLKSNLAKFTQMLQGQRNLETVARMILSELAPLVTAQQGIFYLTDSDANPPVLKLMGSYAYQERKNLSNRFEFGEGLVGQCALEKQKILLTDVPNDYIRINSGLGEAKPLNIIVLPILFEHEVVAVIELASFQRFSPISLTFLEQLSEILGVILNAIASDIRTNDLLQQSQALAQLLQNQQVELQQSNQQLAEKTETLQASEELLRQQQYELQNSNEELQQLNVELEEKAEQLAVQKQEVELKNQELERVRQSLEIQAEELELSSKYKSQFLANMSHELRTPLNSLLILAKLLSENSEANLTAKQIEYSRTIHAAGNDLLELINDILDLAKIESGTMSIEFYPLPFVELRQGLQRIFEEVARTKGLSFNFNFATNLPDAMNTDAKRLQQVLKNLLANAFKFTEQGEVSVTVDFAQQGWSPYNESLNQANAVIGFSVSDTGMGIAPEKQKIIFEAFQQADGSTSRKHGGTGLGLSISREIARLLGGEITLKSRLGEGSIFTLYLPFVGTESFVNSQESVVSSQVFDSLHSTPYSPFPTPHCPLPTSYSPITDDRNNIKPGDRTLLIVEDDVKFAGILYDMALTHGFKCIVTQNGSTGLVLAQQFQPTAILLDINLPGIDGWMVLDRLKHNANTRHIPVHIMTVDERRTRSLQQGAIAYLQKPISSDTITTALTKIKAFVERQVKNLLIVEDDAVQRKSIVELLADDDVATTSVGTGAEALTAIRSQHFDCMVLDLGLPDMSGFALIEQIKQEPNGETLPIIIYTGREITRTQENELRRIADTVIIKDVSSPERLLAESALFLHRVQASLPPNKQEILVKLQSSDTILIGKKVLIVDDDMRNIFALTSMLENHQMQVLYAENGIEGVEILEANPDIDIVLMDVMMPEMDGYETTQKIRQNHQFKSLPVIALTAKAMQGDREKCIEAGASDYITKPVDTEQLLSLLRVWLY
jgi:CheY-like chemotaxis protein/CHASE3 domain sensor protein/putative methionine-R-sulfoxide reductase with GAF domain